MEDMQHKIHFFLMSLVTDLIFGDLFSEFLFLMKGREERDGGGGGEVQNLTE